MAAVAVVRILRAQACRAAIRGGGRVHSAEAHVDVLKYCGNAARQSGIAYTTALVRGRVSDYRKANAPRGLLQPHEPVHV